MILIVWEVIIFMKAKHIIGELEGFFEDFFDPLIVLSAAC
jgi:hypothetical protein